MSGVGVEAEFVVAAAEILDEGVSGADHSCRAEPCEPAHRSQPGFQPPMVGFNRVVGVLLGDVVRGRQQLTQHAGVGRCPVRAHLAGPRRVSQCLGEEPAGGRQVGLGRDQDIDDLPELVHRRYR